MIRVASRSIAATAVMALLGLSHGAHAATKAGITMPDTMQVAGTTLQLNGMGVRTFTILHIRGYVGALYLTKKTTDAEVALSEPGPKAIFMQFVRGASAAKVRDLYLESSRNYCAAHTCSDLDKSAFETLLGTVRDVKAGDRTGFIVTDGGIRVMFNDTELAQIKDPAFGRIILDSDLGSTPPTVELRNGLLGKDDDS